MSEVVCVVTPSVCYQTVLTDDAKPEALIVGHVRFDKLHLISADFTSGLFTGKLPQRWVTSRRTMTAVGHVTIAWRRNQFALAF